MSEQRDQYHTVYHTMLMVAGGRWWSLAARLAPRRGEEWLIAWSVERVVRCLVVREATGRLLLGGKCAVQMRSLFLTSWRIEGGPVIETADRAKEQR